MSDNLGVDTIRVWLSKADYNLSEKNAIDKGWSMPTLQKGDHVSSGKRFINLSHNTLKLDDNGDGLSISLSVPKYIQGDSLAQPTREELASLPERLESTLASVGVEFKTKGRGENIGLRMASLTRLDIAINIPNAGYTSGTMRDAFSAFRPPRWNRNTAHENELGTGGYTIGNGSHQVCIYDKPSEAIHNADRWIKTLMRKGDYNRLADDIAHWKGIREKALTMDNLPPYEMRLLRKDKIENIAQRTVSIADLCNPDLLKSMMLSNFDWFTNCIASDKRDGLANASIDYIDSQLKEVGIPDTIRPLVGIIVRHGLIPKYDGDMKSMLSNGYGDRRAYRWSKVFSKAASVSLKNSDEKMGIIADVRNRIVRG